jgi:hypothetical protein
MARSTWFLITVVLLIGCSSARTIEAPAPPIDKSRLSHSQHAQIKCEACHIGDKRPGASDHKPCDDCHKQAFLSAPGELCKVCHTQVTASPLAAPLKPYPIDDVWRAEPVRFSHQIHMDLSRMENKVGFHVACVDCHVRDGALARPNHATCARCHAPETRLEDAPPMNNCVGCHKAGVNQRTRARLIKNDLRFDHEHHRTDRRGTVIQCQECHSQSAAATGYTDHAPPHIARCVGCHDDTQRTPAELRMRVCETCHTQRQQTLTSLAPRNHLPATERPLDHTLAFRRDHAEAAERDGARCGACHTQMSGNGRDMCDECHQTMRPADHRVTWREFDHGTEASADRDRCARCHVIEFCTACHSQRPRSHGFPGTYSEDHGGQARINVRACLTCHNEQTDCVRSGCHTTRSP